MRSRPGLAALPARPPSSLLPAPGLRPAGTPRCLGAPAGLGLTRVASRSWSAIPPTGSSRAGWSSCCARGGAPSPSPAASRAARLVRAGGRAGARAQGLRRATCGLRQRCIAQRPRSGCGRQAGAEGAPLAAVSREMRASALAAALAGMARAVLEVVAAGAVATPDDLRRFTRCMLLSAQPARDTSLSAQLEVRPGRACLRRPCPLWRPCPA